MKKKSLYDLNLQDKRVLMRVDFNVPLNPDGSIADDTRIKQSLPSINYILSQGGKLILMSHFGRPGGKRVEKLTLAPCAKHLTKLLGQDVKMASDCVGDDARKMVMGMQPKDIVLLENLRFYEAEEHPEKDPQFAKKLASLGECYVNDAFGSAHRYHSSTCTITQHFPHKAAAGFLMEKEISFLSTILLNPKRPFYAVLGGAKLSSKLGVLNSLLTKIDGVFIGGGMVYSFLKAQNISIGNSICEESMIESVKAFTKQCAEKAIKLYLPKDLIIADAFSNEAQKKEISAKSGIPDGWMGMDIGPKTIEEWGPILQQGATIFWNGPMGVFEFSNFAEGTHGLANILSQIQTTTIVGGGDSVAAINQMELEKKFTHISTGGGSTLEFIEKGHLPAIDALSNQ